MPWAGMTVFLTTEDSHVIMRMGKGNFQAAVTWMMFLSVCWVACELTVNQFYTKNVFTFSKLFQSLSHTET